MWFTCDRTGFPVIALPLCGVEAGLLPIAKVQFERFLAEPDPPGDGVYEEMLAMNPRMSYRRINGSHRERLFIAGVLPQEVESFARWMGSGWRVPDADEWREVYAEAANTRMDTAVMDSLRHTRMTRSATIILRYILANDKPKTLADLMLLRHGLLEWVRDNRVWGGLGEPRAEFSRVLTSPLHGPVTLPFNLDVRLPDFGFRLFRNITSPPPSTPGESS